MIEEVETGALCVYFS